MANNVTITGIKYGTTTITASYTDGGVTKTASVENFKVTAITPSLTFTASGSTLTYNGSAQVIGTVSYNGDGTAYYYIQKATSQPSTPSASASGWTAISNGGTISVTDAGTYYVFLKAVGATGGNYTGVDPKQGGNKAIGIRTVSITTTPTYVSTALTYNGSTNSNGTAQTLINTGACSAGGQMYYYVSTSSSAPSWNGGSGWTTTLPTGTNAGNYYVWYYCYVADTNNNSAGTNVSSVKALADGPKTIARAKTATASAVTGLVYNGTTESNGASQSGVTGAHVTWGGSTTGTNAGSYTAYATPESNFAWSDGTYAATTVNWSIARRGQTAPVLQGATTTYPTAASASVKTAGKVENGTANAPGTLVWTNQSRSTAGSQTATAHYAATTTNFSESPESTGVTVKVNARTVTITAPEYVSSTLTYTGSAQTLITSGSCTDGGTMYYYVSTSSTTPTFSTSTWTTTLPTGTNANNYYVWYYCQVTDTTNNTGTGINTVAAVSNGPKVINRAKTATASAVTGLVYNGTTESNGTAQTGVSGSYVSWTGSQTGTNAGSYTAYATPVANYAWSDGTTTQKTITWSIARRGQTAPVLAGDSKAYHNTATATVATSGKVEGGTATAPGTLTWTNQTRTAVGSQTATAYYAATTTNFSASPVSDGVTVEITKATDAYVSVTLTSTTLTYNGSTNSNGTAQTLATATSHGCTYYLIAHTSSSSAPAANASGWTNGSISATNAGTYYIWYKGTADGNHSGDVAITYKGAVTINRAKTATASAVNSLVYNGTTESNGTAQTGVSGSHVTWTGSQTGINAGSYTAYATPESNFAWSDGTYTQKTISWSIARRGQTAPVLQGAETTYPTTASASVKTAGTVAGSTAAAPGTLTWSNQSRSTAGSQNATAYYAATATNFSASPASEAVTVKVNARTVTITAPVFNSDTLTYDKTAKTITSGGSCTSGGTMYYYISTSSTKPSFSTSTWTTTTPVQQTNAGTYYMWYYCKVDDTTNNTGTGINTVTAFTGTSKVINQKTATLSWGNLSHPYDGNSHTATCSVSNLESGDSCSVTLSNQTRTDVGTQTVTATALGNSNYKLPSSPTATLTVSAASFTVSEPDQVYTWTGSAQGVAITVSNLKGSQTATIKYRTASSGDYTLTSAPQITNVSESPLTVYWQVTAPNHAPQTGSYTITINKADAVLPTNWKGDSKAYHNTASLTYTGYSGGTIKFRYDTNGGTNYGTATTTAPTRTTVGNTSVQCMVEGDANHNSTSWSSAVTLTITQATDARMEVTTTNRTYTGSAQVIANQTSGTAEGIATYSLGLGSSSTSAPTSAGSTDAALSVTNAGTYYVWYKFTSDASHSNNKDWTYVGSVVVDKASRSGAVSCNDVTYGSTVQASVSGNTESGTVTWGITADTGAATISSAGVVTPTQAGKVIVTASVAATANYKAYTATSKPITIGKANGSITYNTVTSVSEYCTSTAAAMSQTDANKTVVVATSSASSSTNTGVTIGYTIDSVTKGGSSFTGWSVSSNGQTVTVPKSTAAGTYSVKITATAPTTTNYNVVSVQKTVSVVINAVELVSINLVIQQTTIAFGGTTTTSVYANYNNGSNPKDITSSATYSSDPTGIVTITK